uniref:Uncharacterized protein n=1 Tax=Tetranychus urticae TaxID=32264 RepID=T1KP63_TETUR
MMKGARTEINRRLGIRYYYKKHFDEDYGIKHPSQIEFSGNDPYSTPYSYVENLVLDIYLQDENYYYKIANEVQPLPGIGCPYYFTTHTFIPALKADYVHYHVRIHASGKNKLLRIKSTLLGVTTEAIYDYKLGVSFLLQESGSCRVSSVDLDSPGISSHGYFNLDNLFLFDFIFEYLGKLNLDVFIEPVAEKIE